MRKAILFFMLICESFLFANENSKTQLQIFFKAYEINGIGGETFKVYDNVMIVFFIQIKLLNHLKMLQNIKILFLEKK